LAPAGFFFVIDIAERLTVPVADGETSLGLVCSLRRREAALRVSYHQ
jgi:hypothetical protein